MSEDDSFNRKRAEKILKALTPLQHEFQEVGRFKSTIMAPADGPIYTAVEFLSHETEKGSFSDREINDVVKKLEECFKRLGVDFNVSSRLQKFAIFDDKEAPERFPLPKGLKEEPDGYQVVERGFIEIAPPAPGRSF